MCSWARLSAIRVHERANVTHWILEHAIVDQGAALEGDDDGNE